MPRIKDEDTPEERFEILSPDHLVVTRAGDVILAGGNIVIKRSGVIYLGGKQGVQVRRTGPWVIARWLLWACCSGLLSALGATHWGRPPQ